MTHEKARLFGDLATRQTIVQSTSPEQAKGLALMEVRASLRAPHV